MQRLLLHREVRTVAHFGGPEADLLNQFNPNDRGFSTRSLPWRPHIPADIGHSSRRFCKLHGPITQRIWRPPQHSLCAHGGVDVPHTPPGHPIFK